MTSVVTGLVLAFNGALMSRRQSAATNPESASAALIFAFFPSAIWFMSILRHAPAAWEPPLLALLGLGLGLLALGIRYAEMGSMGRLYFVPAIGFGILQGLDRDSGIPWWSPTIVGFAATAACHVLKRPSVKSGTETGVQLWEAVLSLGVVSLITVWLQARFESGNWIIVASLTSLGLTAYGLGTGLRWMAGAAQLLQWLALITWAHGLFQAPVSAVASCVLILAGLVYARVSEHIAARVSPEQGARLRDLARVHDGTAILILLGWTWRTLDPAWLGGVWTGMAAALLALGWMSRRFRVLGCGMLLLAAAFVSLIVHHSSSDPASRLMIQMGAPLLMGVGLQQLARRYSNRIEVPENLQRVWIGALVLGFWFFTSRWTVSAMGGRVLETLGFVTMGLMIFAGGIGLHERGYRRGGLALLGFALGRALLVDVWTLSLPYRIVCCLGLGVALLVLGYFYNRFQDRLRPWL